MLCPLTPSRGSLILETQHPSVTSRTLDPPCLDHRQSNAADPWHTTPKNKALNHRFPTPVFCASQKGAPLFIGLSNCVPHQRSQPFFFGINFEPKVSLRRPKMDWCVCVCISINIYIYMCIYIYKPFRKCTKQDHHHHCLCTPLPLNIRTW